jgi:hypothetical protein
VINTRNWLPGKKVLVSLLCITAIDWTQGKVHINLSREGLRRSPEYDSSKLADQYFNQPYFWLN